MDDVQLYSKYNGMQRADVEYVLRLYLEFVRWSPDGQDNVLDVGCGEGNVTAELLMPRLPANFGALVGVDKSPEMVNHARKYNQKEQRVRFVVADVSAERLPCDLGEKESYHHVFSFYCLHWIQDQRQCLKNLYDLMVPGGDILLTFLATNPIFQVYEILAKNAKWSKYMKNVTKYISPYQNVPHPDNEFRDLLTEVGFEIEICKFIERTHVFDSVNVLKKSIIAVNPFMNKIPEVLRDDYIEDMLDEIRNLNCYILLDKNNNEGGVKTEYKLLVAYATKPL